MKFGTEMYKIMKLFFKKSSRTKHKIFELKKINEELYRIIKLPNAKNYNFLASKLETCKNFQRWKMNLYRREVIRNLTEWDIWQRTSSHDVCIINEYWFSNYVHKFFSFLNQLRYFLMLISKMQLSAKSYSEVHFYLPTPENLDNPEKNYFPRLSRVSKKKIISDLESTPQKIFIKTRKRRIFMCAWSKIIPVSNWTKNLFYFLF